MSAPIRTRFLLLITRIKTPIRLNRKCYHTTDFNYARVLRRRAKGVLTTQEELDSLSNSITKMKTPTQDAYVPFVPFDPVQRMMKDVAAKNKKIYKTKSSPQNEKRPRQANDRIFKLEKNGTNDIEYETLKEGDTKLSSLVIGSKSRSQREKSGDILLEGHRLISDAVLSGAFVHTIFFTDKDTLMLIPFKDLNPTLYRVQYKHLKIWSDTKTPPGIMAICKMPKQGECLIPDREVLPVSLICDNVRDPGNMGTLIRTAAAVGCQNIITTRGCVDLWEPKVLRSGSGAHFHIPVYTGIGWEFVANYISDQKNVFIADVEKMSSKKSPKIDTVTAERLLSASEASMDNDKNTQESAEFLNTDMEELYEDAPIPSSLYYHGNFEKDKDIVLIIGGETEGISVKAKKFAFDNFGECLSIPMTGRINSLNSSVAASIILYEIKRQLYQK